MMLSLLTSLALAGEYGMPVDGYPNDVERALVLWTNAARVAPKEFTSEYRSGGCALSDFSDDEKTAKAPLYLDLALTEVARVHSEDMRENGCFQHESCDGTDTWTRIGRYYKDANQGMGENIAAGSADPKYSVMSMWMCSTSGHRANIMSSGFNEMGGGVAAEYMTQDFAWGELNEGSPPVRVAAEYGSGVYADWGADEAPSRVDLILDGEVLAMDFVYGEPEQGIYYVEASAEDGTPWAVRWQSRTGETGYFPEEGALLFGSGADEYDATVSFGSDDVDDGGAELDGGDGVIALPDLMCASASGPLGSAGLVLTALLALRRRR